MLRLVAISPEEGVGYFETGAGLFVIRPPFNDGPMPGSKAVMNEGIDSGRLHPCLQNFRNRKVLEGHILETFSLSRRIH